MKFLCVLLLTILLIAVMTTVNGTSVPVCGYINSKGEQQFLRWWDYKKEGDEYIDGDDGLCTKRAVCTETYETKVEDCSAHKVTCENKNSFAGLFPACCVKC